MTPRIVVGICTTGRPDIVAEAVRRLHRQTRPADDIVVAGAVAADLPPLEDARGVVAPSKGASAQRNHALDLIGDAADVVVFVDDDYVAAPGFIEGVERLFSAHPDIVAASGLLLADGIHSQGLTFEEADALIVAHEAEGPPADALVPDTGTYGCNMAFRIAAAPHLRFDERLPLYSWLEDTDFSARIAPFGRIVRATHFYGVHLGVKRGRGAGLRLGYSQIANVLYLVRKGTVKPRFGYGQAARNVLANAVKSLRPEPWVDRRGRLRGNLLALFDALRGRCDPMRILEL